MFPSKGDFELLLQQMKAGSVSSFDTFYEQFVSLVYPIAYRMMKDKMEAEDICHDVFLEVWNKGEQYDAKRGSIEAWLVVKTKSRCIDRLRRKSRFSMESITENDESMSGISPKAEELALERLQREYLKNAIVKLSVKQREAVFGFFYQGHSHRELSDHLKQPLGTIKSLIRYGVNNLRNQLLQSGWIEPSEGGKQE